jgi:tripartite-type tricarboxylate transporter receptor subunit TctC
MIARARDALAGALAVLLSSGSLLSASPSLAADPVAEFYGKRTINLIIGSGEGGLYDTAGRLIAQHLKRFIPGSPTIVPQNMAGASSVRATEYLFNVAPRDGTALAFVQPTVVLNRVLDPTAKYDPRQMNWIGRLQPMVFVGIAWHGAPAMSVAEAKQKALILAANAPTGAAAMVPWALNQLVGTKFTVIRGYESETANMLALQRGEVQGIGSMTLTDFLEKKWAEQKIASVLYTIDLQRAPEVPDAPAIVELAANDADRAVLGLLANPSSIGQTVMAPPGLPADRLAALRDAFAKMTKDKAFIADAEKRSLSVDPLGGPELAKLVDENFAVSPDLVQKLKVVTAPPR